MRTSRLLACAALAVFASLAAEIALAQSQATPGAQGTPGACPSPGWIGPPPPGVDCHAWVGEQQGCDQVAAKFAAWQKMNEADRQTHPWTPKDRSDWEVCLHEAGAWSAQKRSNLQPPNMLPPVPLLKLPPPPLPQATPSAGGAAPQGSSASDPPFGAQFQFPGGGGAACSTGQPPDVAAEVSPAQNVEFLNQGLWVSNKDGTAVSSCSSQAATTPCKTLNQFWCPAGATNPLPGCSSTALPFDTQIIFDPFDQRWIATSESQDFLNLYFAVSNSADASGSWSLWSLPSLGQGSICPSSTYPDIDQPVVGYSSSWVAVDILCYTSGGVNAPNDSLVLIPNSNITGGTFTPTVKQLTGYPNFMRPSRDLSAKASPAPTPYPYLVLAGPNVPSNSSPYLTFASIDSSGNFASGSGILSGNGGPIGATGSFTLPYGQQPGCTTYSPGSPGCEIRTGDARVQQVIIQYDRHDGTHYAFATFATGFSPTQSQALMFMEQIETGTTSGTQTVGGVVAYPSIAVDEDLDIYQTWTEFLSTIDPFSTYFLTVGPIFEGETQFVGEGNLQTSSAAYTGDLNCAVLLDAALGRLYELGLGPELGKFQRRERCVLDGAAVYDRAR